MVTNKVNNRVDTKYIQKVASFLQPFLETLKLKKGAETNKQLSA